MRRWQGRERKVEVLEREGRKCGVCNGCGRGADVEDMVGW